VEIDATIIVVLFFIESHKDTSKMVISVLSLLETREPLMSIKNMEQTVFCHIICKKNTDNTPTLRDRPAAHVGVMWTPLTH
jgi:hypothetical protein